MPPRLLLALCLGLAACGTPQERCINGQTRDLRVVNRLIDETETNLARGYALEEITVTRTVWVQCDPAVIVVQPDGSRRVARSGRMCLDDRDETITRPRAIDPVSERSKLDGLLARQRALTKQARSAVEQCRLIYPQ